MPVVNIYGTKGAFQILAQAHPSLPHSLRSVVAGSTRRSLWETLPIRRQYDNLKYARNEAVKKTFSYIVSESFFETNLFLSYYLVKTKMREVTRLISKF